MRASMKEKLFFHLSNIESLAPSHQKFTNIYPCTTNYNFADTNFNTI